MLISFDVILCCRMPVRALYKYSWQRVGRFQLAKSPRYVPAGHFLSFVFLSSSRGLYRGSALWKYLFASTVSCESVRKKHEKELLWARGTQWNLSSHVWNTQWPTFLLIVSSLNETISFSGAINTNTFRMSSFHFHQWIDKEIWRGWKVKFIREF